jgi:inosine-uridine nucleoside N-ribohydrolase
MSVERPIRLIIDTDIGDNVDDALALGLACRSPELQLAGVTTVYRDPHERSLIALAVLDAFGAGFVPVAAGIGKPLGRVWDRSHLRFGGARYTHLAARMSPQHAVPFLLRAVSESHEPLTICCIGPLTNLAVALAMNPTLVDGVRIVLMGGMVGGKQCETNIAADPEAAQMVFSSGANITMVGLDVTSQCQLGAEEIERIRCCVHPSTQLMAEMIDAWMMQSHRLPTLHDPLAVAMCFEPGLCETEPMQVSVETSMPAARGATSARIDPDSKTRVCKQVDHRRFLQLFVDRMKRTCRT